MEHWLHKLQKLQAQRVPVVRMAVAAVRGSAPREPGATLLFWIDAGGVTQIHGSIGGGHLELRAMEIARSLLEGPAAQRRTERFTLGAALGQCCGGAVELFWERFDDPAQLAWLECVDLAAGAMRFTPVDGNGDCTIRAGCGAPELAAGFIIDNGRRYFAEYLCDDRSPIYLYGAGHVGRALTQVLRGLPFGVCWIDSRDGMGEDVEHAEQPERLALAAPAEAWHLVMTHSHDEDFRICEALVGTGRFGFLGVIGSATKQARFRSRLLDRGHPPDAVARMVSPIGIAGIDAKLPAAIALSVAAQLMQLREAGIQSDRKHTHGVRTA